jgi:hypothetical protein
MRWADEHGLTNLDPRSLDAKELYEEWEEAG